MRRIRRVRRVRSRRKNEGIGDEGRRLDEDEGGWKRMKDGEGVF